MRVVVHEFISLDRVVQGPGKPGGLGEDTIGGFRHGGWSVPYNDSEVWAAINQFAERSGAVLLGRSTYRSGAVWPDRPGPFADWINRAQKYVVSGTRSGSDDTPWKPTTIIRGADLLKEVARLCSSSARSRRPERLDRCLARRRLWTLASRPSYHGGLHAARRAAPPGVRRRD